MQHSQAFGSWVRRLDAVATRPGAFCPADFFLYRATLHNAKPKATAADKQRSHANDYSVTVLPLFIHASEDAHAVLRLFTAHEGLQGDVAAQILLHGAAQHSLWEQERSALAAAGSAAAAAAAVAAAAAPPPPQEGCVDGSRLATRNDKFFVEIGTSDFDNMHQQLFLDSSWSGLAVEPLPELFAVLPRRPGLLRENAALGCGAGVRELSMLGVNRANQQAFGLPRWALGTGTVVSEMQNRASHQLVGDDWPWDALVRTNVTCRSWADIAAKHGIRATRLITSESAEEVGGPHFNIDLLKVDAEFADVLVVNEVLDWLEAAERALLGAADDSARTQRVVYPSQVVFEIFNEKEGMSETLRERFLSQNVLLDRFYGLGYECKRTGQDVQCLLCSDSRVKCEGAPPPRRRII